MKTTEILQVLSIANQFFEEASCDANKFGGIKLIKEDKNG
jgi:hypothetical protein